MSFPLALLGLLERGVIVRDGTVSSLTGAIPSPGQAP